MEVKDEVAKKITFPGRPACDALKKSGYPEILSWLIPVHLGTCWNSAMKYVTVALFKIVSKSPQ
jgi:hypothetical protein